MKRIMKMLLCLLAAFGLAAVLAPQTHLIIRWDDGFQIQRKYQLISALGKGIILTVFLFHCKYNYTMRAGFFGTRFLCSGGHQPGF